MSRRSHGWSGRTVTDARRYWTFRIHEAAKAGEPLACYLCANPVLPTDAWVVEHVVPRSVGGPVRQRTNQWVSHARCSSQSGAAMTNAAKTVDKQRLWTW